MTDIHIFFGLSYASHLVLDPPTSDEINAMLLQLWRAYPQFTGVERVALTGREWEVGDFGQADLARWGITSNADGLHDTCACGPEPEQGDGESDAAFLVRYREWDNARWGHEDYALRWTIDGEQYERGDLVVLPDESLEQGRRRNRLVIPRSLLQSMPDDWQHEFVGLLHAADTDRNFEQYTLYCYDAAGRDIAESAPPYNRGRTHVEPQVTA